MSQKCHKCKSTITSGTVLTVDSKHYHPDHFTCSKCDRVIGGATYFPVDGKHLCDRCHVQDRCVTCSKVIDGGKKITEFGVAFHKECFVCGSCHKQLTTFFEHNKRPYCKECHNSKYALKCGKCHDAINGQEPIRAMGKDYHAKCFSCHSCGKEIGANTFYRNDAGDKITCERCEDKKHSSNNKSSSPVTLAPPAHQALRISSGGTGYTQQGAARPPSPNPQRMPSPARPPATDPLSPQAPPRSNSLAPPVAAPGGRTSPARQPSPARGNVAVGSGRHKALVIGINYVAEPRSALKGCHNDAENIRQFLISVGYPAGNIRMLRDKPGDEQPTRANILAGIKWLMEGVKAGDSLFMHYSGHGTQTDANGASSTKDDFEEDGKDEALMPCDFKKAGILVDDDLNDMLVVPLPEGARLTALFDCCHSGTALDLPYTEVARTDAPAPRSVREQQLETRSRELATKRAAYMETLRAKPRGSSSGAPASPAKPAPHGPHDGSSGKGEALLFSGCQDDQCSADTSFEGQAQGAMSHAFIGILKETGGQITYLDLLYKMRQAIGKGAIKQTPQISFNNAKFNLEQKIVL